MDDEDFVGRGGSMGVRPTRRTIEHANHTPSTKPASAKKQRNRRGDWVKRERSLLKRDGRYYAVLVENHESTSPERRAKVVDGETGKSVRGPRPQRRTLMRCCEAMDLAEALNRKERKK